MEKDATVLKDWQLNEEVWKAQFRLTGNWSTSIDGCRLALKTAAKLKDRQILTKCAIACRHLRTREEDGAEEALRLFREGCVLDAIQRVWNWEDDRLLMWVCLCLTDVGLKDSLRSGVHKDVETLFSALAPTSTLPKGRCADIKVNSFMPLNCSFALLRWMTENEIHSHWFLEKVSYDFSDIRYHCSNGGDEHFAILLFKNAIRCMNEDWMSKPASYELLEVVHSLSWFVHIEESQYDELMDDLTAPLRVMVLTHRCNFMLRSYVSQISLIIGLFG